MDVLGFVFGMSGSTFGLLGFVMAMNASGKVEELEKKIEILKSEQAGE